MANQNQDPLVHIDDATAADARRRGQDPQELELYTKTVLQYLYTCLPDTPVNANALLSALPGGDPSGEDRISALPFGILRNIVSRLPAKDPGPFRAVHVVCCYMDAHQPQLARWARTLVDKRVEELVLVNRPWPLALPLPAPVLRAATLTTLYLGFWKFPDASALPRGDGAAFPNLRELFLASVDIESRGMEFLLSGSPALEKLGILGCAKHGFRLHLVGRRLRCVQIGMSRVETIAVMDTPSLERLFIHGSITDHGSYIRVKIGNAPKLRLLGYLEPGVHMLEIRSTFIHPGISASPSTVVTNVNILGLAVRFGVCNDVKILPTFLRCFPNVETLHIMSHKTKKATAKLDLNFWQKVDPIESIQCCIKVMTFREFRGEPSESAFLKFVFQNAQVLKNAVIVAANGCFTSIPDAISKVRTLKPDNWGNNCSVLVRESSGPDGGKLWSFRAGFEFSVNDPFVYH